MTVTADESLGTIDAAPAPDASVAVPGASPFHGVSDSELDSFDALRRAVPFAVAGVFAGVFVATVAGAIGAMLAIGGGDTGFGDILLILVNALSLGIAATASVFAMRGTAEVTQTLTAIRGRDRITLAPEIDNRATP